MSRSKPIVGTSRDSPPEARDQAHSENEDDSDVNFGLDADSEKSEAEEELERLVFGDSAGFRQQLKDFAVKDATEESDALEITGLEGLDDADVGLVLTGRAVTPVADDRIALCNRS